ncbi:hypothetical protein BKN38_07305 [Helicobacter sp. CLO-3]|nr:hypothetical protein BA723_05590 [Helicobacter sp. CLO-3]OHU82336.1 hypothetical protein BKN38_07305 [Helicobacter sp. CLO-3]
MQNLARFGFCYKSRIQKHLAFIDCFVGLRPPRNDKKSASAKDAKVSSTSAKGKKANGKAPKRRKPSTKTKKMKGEAKA